MKGGGSTEYFVVLGGYLGVCLGSNQLSTTPHRHRGEVHGQWAAGSRGDCSTTSRCDRRASTAPSVIPYAYELDGGRFQVPTEQYLGMF